MSIRPLTTEDHASYNKVVTHPLQSYEWGKFRERTGIKVIRRGIFKNNQLVSGFQLTIHKIPRTSFTIGYLPKGELPDKVLIEELKKIGKENNCIFIQLEPDVIQSINGSSMENGKCPDDSFHSGSRSNREKMENKDLKPAAHPLFTKYNFVLDLTKSEEELLKNMHAKARYNIKVALKHDVKVTEDNSDKAFKAYLQLTEETTKRQSFYAHSRTYHKTQWETLKHPQMENGNWKLENQLTSHLFTATYEKKILTTLLFFVFHDTLYYPYGASSNEHRNVMHSNLAMWEGIKFGKKLGLKKFDMWGALGPNPDPKDPWYGFHNFKEKYGPDNVEYIGSYDLVINPILYQAYKVADKLRWMMLKLKK